MPENNSDLHGFVPDQSPVVLILIDVINDAEFPEGEHLMEFALPMAEKSLNSSAAPKPPASQ